jgi:hypothetical protein
MWCKVDTTKNTILYLLNDPRRSKQYLFGSSCRSSFVVPLTSSSSAMDGNNNLDGEIFLDPSLFTPFFPFPIFLGAFFGCRDTHTKISGVCVFVYFRNHPLIVEFKLGMVLIALIIFMQHTYHIDYNLLPRQIARSGAERSRFGSKLSCSLYLRKKQKNRDQSSTPSYLLRCVVFFLSSLLFLSSEPFIPSLPISFALFSIVSFLNCITFVSYLSNILNTWTYKPYYYLSLLLSLDFYCK